MSISPTNVFLAEQRFGAAYDRASTRALAPGRVARILAHLRGSALDRALAQGVDPLRSRQLSARACVLTSSCTRADVAEALERLVAAAGGPHRRWWALQSHDTVLAHREELEALAGTLRSHQPVYAGGVALLNQLLTDGTGPVFRGDQLGLARQLQHARLALAG